ncbi:MAG: DUF2177 family protein [Pseudolabrys sp.]
MSAIATFAIAYAATFLVFAAVDAAWLSQMGPALYKPVLGDMLAPSLRIAPAIAFYLILPIGIVVFAVSPALKSGHLSDAVVHGLLFGAIAYATYDLTNYATLKNWSLTITVLDIVYGAVASAAAATVAVLAVRTATRWIEA